MSLSNNVIAKDHRLDDAFQHAADELMEHRWHWTLDESNPKRVSIVQYAKDVGKARTTIGDDARGWAAYLKSIEGVGAPRHPGAAATPADFRGLAKMSGEKQEAAKAIAKNTGKSISTVTRHNRKDVDAVVNRARNKAVEKGTSVESEIDKAAEWKAKADRAAAAEKSERKRKHTATFIKIEGKLGKAIREVRDVLGEAEGVEFTDEETTILNAAIGNLRAVLNLVDMRIAGTVNVDWDTELQKITQ